MILVFIIVALLLFVVGYGLYLTFGPGKTDLRDPIDEHAKMHELGIAHGHTSKATRNCRYYKETIILCEFRVI